MSGLNRTPGKRVYVSKRTAGSNPALSAIYPGNRHPLWEYEQMGLRTDDRGISVSASLISDAALNAL